MFVSNGILFNHESPRRGTNFVTNKVVKEAVKIKLGLQDELELGNMDSYRDWGHSKDYVRAMHMMINHDTPEDFVVSTMKTHSVREMVDYVFTKLNLDYKDYVIQNQKFVKTPDTGTLVSRPKRLNPTACAAQPAHTERCRGRRSDSYVNLVALVDWRIIKLLN